MKELQDAIDEVKFQINMVRNLRANDQIVYETKVVCYNKEIDRLERLQYSLEGKLSKLKEKEQ